MTRYGSRYERERAAFKAECAARNEPCWICRNTIGPIDYVSRFDPSTKQPLLFSLDHATATTLHGAVNDRKNFRASHLRCNSSRGNGTRGQFPTNRRW